jgi:hypothetical protein
MSIIGIVLNLQESRSYCGLNISKFLGYKVVAHWLSYLVGNKCHNIFLFISVCNIGYIDVSCSELNDVLVMLVGDQSISELKFIKYTQMLAFWWCCRVKCDRTKFWRELVSWICFEVEQMFCVSQSSISNIFVSYSSALECHVTFQSVVVDISKDCTGKPRQAIATCTSSLMVWISYARRAWTIYELG